MLLLDSNFLMDLEEEHALNTPGPCRHFLGTHRGPPIAVSIVSVAEFAAGEADELKVRQFLARFHWLALKEQVAFAAAAVERDLRRAGLQLGENDTWIAGFARYYSATLVTRDGSFAHVPGLKLTDY